MAESETKHDKFKRIATRRVRDIIKKIENIGKLSAPVYEYSEEEIEKIFASIQETLDNAKNKFFAKQKGKNSFEL